MKPDRASCSQCHWIVPADQLDDPIAALIRHVQAMHGIPEITEKPVVICQECGGAFTIEFDDANQAVADHISIAHSNDNHTE